MCGTGGLCAWLGKRSAQGVALLVIVAVVRIEGYPALLECGRSITAGSEVMGAPTQLQTEAPRVKLARGGAEIECGGKLLSGETGLTFSWPISTLMDEGHFLVEAVASVGQGVWGVEGGSCGKTRAVDTDESRYTAPNSGNVTVRAAWAISYGTVSVNSDCNYTIECKAGFAGVGCAESRCPAHLVPSSIYRTAPKGAKYACVPPALQQRPGVANCSVENSWKEILATTKGARYSMGGLGKFLLKNRFENWLCDKNAPCLPSEENGVCYIFDEILKVFVPWGKWRYIACCAL